MKINYLNILFLILFLGCKSSPRSEETTTEDTTSSAYASELINFTPYAAHSVFAGTGANTWDQHIRERGYILREDSTYHMWYTGYREGPDATMHLGYATSPDGFTWTRHPDNPIFDESWVEDMMVIKHDSLYHMFAEGRNDIAHRLTSTDRIHWEDHGSLDIRQVNGEPLSPGPYGTPTVWIEGDTWYLFYERNDLGIWLATSKDLEVWTNIQDDPVLTMGPEEYDQYGVALNQVVKHDGLYYAYYHGTPFEDWSLWSTNLATSEDLIHWKKYEENPIMEDNKSSGILVHDGEQYRLYTMHPEVCVHFPSDNVDEKSSQ
jgi:predicted GH43/DUF377 family glycosyl hydrolase